MLGYSAIKTAPTAKLIVIPVIHVFLDSDTMHYAHGCRLILPLDSASQQRNFG